MTRKRGFELVVGAHRQHPGAAIVLPVRASRHSAGYDLCTPVPLSIPPGGRVRFATDLKAYMGAGEVLCLYPRSSVGFRGVRLCNTVGVVDADYFGNPENDGNIVVCLHNAGEETFAAAPGDRLIQAVFTAYLLADGDSADTERQGGLGHSGA